MGVVVAAEVVEVRAVAEQAVAEQAVGGKVGPAGRVDPVEGKVALAVRAELVAVEGEAVRAELAAGTISTRIM